MVDANTSVDNLQHIASLYQQVDNYLENSRVKAELTDDNTTNVGGAIDRKQRINDQAYFVLAWGQLETDIKSACRNIIEHGQSHRDWRNRRVWTLYNLNDRRLSSLSFENRLTLVLEKGSKNWKRTLQFHQLRNQIAHGKLLLKRIDVSAVIQGFFHIQSSLASE